MKKKTKLLVGIMIVIITQLFVFGCVTTPKYTWTPGVIAVLPFTNESADVSIDKFVRYDMYSQLKLRKHKLLSLEEVDAKLDELGITEGGQLAAVSSEELAEYIDADTFMYGDVLEAKRVMLGVYFNKKLTAKFTLYSADNGEHLWEVTRTAKESKISINPTELMQTALQEFAYQLTMDAIAKAFKSHPLRAQIKEVVFYAVKKFPKP